MNKRDNALRILNSIELQNQMAPPDFLGEKVKGAIVDGVADEKFGMDREHPILCNDVFGEECYLSRLREEGTGSPLIFHRRGSTRGTFHMLDVFECITLTGNYYILYMDMYYYDQCKIAPKGFYLREKADGLTGFSCSFISSFPDVYDEVSKYAKSRYGYKIVDESIRTAANESKGFRTMEELKRIVDEERARK